MKNFKENEMTDLSSIVGGETASLELSKLETVEPDGCIKVSYDLRWVCKKC